MMSVRFAAACALLACLHAQPRQDTRTVTASRHEYTIAMGGTEDAANTRDPIVYPAWKPGYEPMRSVKLENTGTTDVVNPWIVVNGKRNWRTVADIVSETLRTYGDPARMSERDKARAIWEFFRTHRFHATTGDLDVRDPVKMLNVYGFALCGDNAPVLMELWRAAGLRARRGYPIAHCVSETWYEGAWHMLDGDESILFLDRDNQTILPENAVARDHDLSKRAYKSQSLPALYNYDATHTGDFPSHEQHRMDFSLRPGESIEWRFGQGEKFHYAPNPVLFLLESADLHRWGANAWATLRNGKWSYTPRDGGPWKIRTPYVIVGGRIEAAAGSTFSASHDGREWKRVPATGDLAALFPSPGDAHYEFVVRRDSGAGAVTIEADLQMAPLAMPSLELGTNRVQYTDQTSGARSVQISFDWVERGTSQPPAAPLRAGDLQWSEVGDAVAYHFELSDEPSIRWPLSPAYTVVQPGRAWSPLTPGLLNPGQTYYWHVRAKSRAGIWGPWSTTFQFVPQGPATPLRPRFEEREPGQMTLVWDPAPSGAEPVRYRIYASDEKGFSVSDKQYEVATGGAKNRGYFEGKSSVTFDANFVAETAEPAFRVSPTRAFWRVVAVDAQGHRSGSSDYAEAPRPWIYSTPVRTVKVGQPYRYEAKTIRSIGDLTFHHSFPDGQGQEAFWTADEPVFSFEDEMPRCGNFEARWLHLDPKSGVLSGTPGADAVGEYQVNLRVEIRGRVHLQSFPLIVTAVAAAPTGPLLFGDTSRLGRPFAKDPSVIKFQGRYLLYYSIPGRSGSDAWGVGIASSPDLKSWERVGEITGAAPYESKGIAAPFAKVIDWQVHLFYQTYGNGPGDAICHAVSRDGIHFERDPANPIFRPTGGGVWNSGRAIDGEVVRFQGRWLLYAATRDPSSKIQMVVGAASSSSFSPQSWKMLADAPLLKPELPWEQDCIEAPSIVVHDGYLYMFYAGAYNNAPQQIGVARSGDGVHWQRLGKEPFLRNGKPGEWNASESGHPGVFVDDDGQTYLFFQGNNDKGNTWRISFVKIGWRDGAPHLQN